MNVKYSEEQLVMMRKAEACMQLNRAHSQFRQRCAHLSPEPAHRLLLLDPLSFEYLQVVSAGLVPDMETGPWVGMLREDPMALQGWVLFHPATPYQRTVVVVVPNVPVYGLIEFYA